MVHTHNYTYVCICDGNKAIIRMMHGFASEQAKEDDFVMVNYYKDDDFAMWTSLG